MAQVQKLFGPPGTGKTTRLLSIMEEHLAAGVRSQDIGYFSFTQKAADEARKRAMHRFGLAKGDLPFFRTLHSLVFGQLNLRRDQVMGGTHWQELGDALGLRFEGRTQVEDGSMYGMGAADRLRFIESLSRVRKESLETTWLGVYEDELNWWELERFARALRMYKDGRRLVDFNDMLDEFVEVGDAVVPRLKVLIGDEMQDLSVSQWRVFRAIAEKAEIIYIAGDEEQAIYDWAGADPGAFLDFPVDKMVVLDQSHRVPSAVHKAALTVSSRIVQRQEKTWHPKPGDPGAVLRYLDTSDVDLHEAPDFAGIRQENPNALEWLLLARNGYMLADLEQMCLEAGYAFSSVGRSPLDSSALKAILTWEKLRKGQQATVAEIDLALNFVSQSHFPLDARSTLKSQGKIPLGMGELQQIGLRWQGDVPVWFEALTEIPAEEREYFIAARRRGERLTAKPRISISTIHAAKGGEAQNVLLLSDLSTKSFQSMERNPDSEARVFYVAMTRAQRALHIVEPRSHMFYQM
jgi:DNA helicase-2/ATP-dependent DNA helicase PcrA